MCKLYHMWNSDTRIFHCAYTITQASISAVSRLLHHAGECPSWTLCALMLLLCLTVHLQRRYSELSVQIFRFVPAPRGCCQFWGFASKNPNRLTLSKIVCRPFCVRCFLPTFRQFSQGKSFPFSRCWYLCPPLLNLHALCPFAESVDTSMPLYSSYITFVPPILLFPPAGLIPLALYDVVAAGTSQESNILFYFTLG